MKKRVLAVILAVVMVLGITGCGESGENPPPVNNDPSGNNNPPPNKEPLIFDDINKPLGERELASVIPEGVISNGMTLKNVTIDRRQTNLKEDVVYTTIEMENDYAHRTEYYRFTINFYDVGGWMIDEHESYKAFESVPIKPPPHDIPWSRSLLYYGNEGYEVTFSSADTTLWGSGVSTFIYEVMRDGKYISRSGNVSVSIRFNISKNGWRMEHANPNINENLKFHILLEDLSNDLLGTWQGNWSSGLTGLFSDEYNFRMNISNISETHLHVTGRMSIAYGSNQILGGDDYIIDFISFFEHNVIVEDNTYYIKGNIPLDGYPNIRYTLTVQEDSVTIQTGWHNSFMSSGGTELTRVG
jgi:hypothetical protein